jgi:hypothetical protein
MTIFTIACTARRDGRPYIAAGNVEAPSKDDAMLIAWDVAFRAYPPTYGYRDHAVVADPFTPLASVTHLEVA